MQELPSVSIIVPVRNAERTLDKTFEYLFAVKYPRDKMEILIVDGGSTDKTIEVIKKWQAKYPFIRLTEVPNCPSPGFARNKALDVAKGEFLFFTDGDCAPCEEWIAEILEKFKIDPNIGAVGGEIFTLKVEPNNLTELWCQHFRFNMVSPRYGFIDEGYFPKPSDYAPTQIAGHRAYFFITANVAYRKNAIERAKARFWTHPTGEDVDLSHQIQKAGYRLYFAPKAKVNHMHRANFGALKKVWVTYGAAHVPLIAKYSPKVFEVVFQFLKRKPRIKFPFPIRGFIYLGNLHMMHIFWFLFLVSLILSPKLFSLVAFFFASYFTYRTFKWCFYMEPKKNILTWCKMLYMTNLSFIRGGMKGFFKYKIFCIEPSFY